MHTQKLFSSTRNLNCNITVIVVFPLLFGFWSEMLSKPYVSNQFKQHLLEKTNTSFFNLPFLSPPSKDFVSKPPLRLKQTPSTLMRRGFCWNVDGSNDWVACLVVPDSGRCSIGLLEIERVHFWIWQKRWKH